MTNCVRNQSVAVEMLGLTHITFGSHCRVQQDDMMDLEGIRPCLAACTVQFVQLQILYEWVMESKFCLSKWKYLQSHILEGFLQYDCLSWERSTAGAWIKGLTLTTQNPCSLYKNISLFISHSIILCLSPVSDILKIKVIAFKFMAFLLYLEWLVMPYLASTTMCVCVYICVVIINYTQIKLFLSSFLEINDLFLS